MRAPLAILARRATVAQNELRTLHTAWHTPLLSLMGTLKVGVTDGESGRSASSPPCSPGPDEEGLWPKASVLSATLFAILRLRCKGDALAILDASGNRGCSGVRALCRVTRKYIPKAMAGRGRLCEQALRPTQVESALASCREEDRRSGPVLSNKLSDGQVVCVTSMLPKSAQEYFHLLWIVEPAHPRGDDPGVVCHRRE